MVIISSTAYWSAYVSRAIIVGTLVLAPLLVGLFTLFLVWLAYVLGAPVDPAFDFTVEASVALTDRLLLLGLIAAFFALTSLIARCFVWMGKNRQVDPDSFLQGYLLAVLLAVLLKPMNFYLNPWLHTPNNLSHPNRRHFRLASTPAAMAGATPLQI